MHALKTQSLKRSFHIMVFLQTLVVGVYGVKRHHV